MSQPTGIMIDPNFRGHPDQLYNHIVAFQVVEKITQEQLKERFPRLAIDEQNYPAYPALRGMAPTPEKA